MVGRPKGIPKTGGRKRGTPNKLTAQLKDMILEAAELAGDDIKPGGGTVAYLKKQAEENPGPFMSLLGKVLPTQIAGDPENPLHMHPGWPYAGTGHAWRGFVENRYQKLNFGPELP